MFNNTQAKPKKIYLPDDIVKINFTTKYRISDEWDKFCKSKRIPKSWKITDLILNELRRNGINI
mgnify:FL=1